MFLDNKSAASLDLAADAEMLRVMPDPHLVRKTLRRQRGVLFYNILFATFCQTTMPIRTAFPTSAPKQKYKRRHLASGERGGGRRLSAGAILCDVDNFGFMGTAPGHAITLDELIPIVLCQKELFGSDNFRDDRVDNSGSQSL
jgi:hypothetical protein